MSALRYWCLVSVVALVFHAQLSARVVRMDITGRQDVQNGQSFGNAGAYERLTGKLTFSVAIANRFNAGIVDLPSAENRKGGEVEFSAEFFAVRPKDPAKANGTLLLEVPNRGKSRFLSLVDGGDWDLQGNTGDGWLLRNGYTVVALGWQWDATGSDALHLFAPVAKQNGQPIEGLLRGDFMLPQAAADVPLGHLINGTVGGTEYPVAHPDDKRNQLTVRPSRDASRKLIARSEWAFARLVDGRRVPSDRYLTLQGGFQPGLIYEYVYVVQNPVIAGLGLAAVRDFASFAKHDGQAPLRAKNVIAEGISQNGRFLRDFLYQGFNADEEGRPALDGVLAHVAGAGRGSFNFRFAQPSRDAQPTSSVFYPTDLFPFTDSPETDGVTGQTAGLLDRARAQHVVPKIFLSNTSYEYWGRVASLIHTTADGKRDLPPSDDVRIYHYTGLQHFSVPFPPVRGKAEGAGQQPQSPLPIQYFWRAMLQNMREWITTGKEPPASKYPRLEDGTLVPLERYAFPAIPAVEKPHEASRAYRLDFGEQWKAGLWTRQPPLVGEPYPVLVPAVDPDGNEIDGVRLPELSAPLATYTGWNLRSAAIGAPTERVAFEGSFLPFSKTEEDRRSAGDPRKSIAERYRDGNDYLQRFSRALDELIGQRYILPEDRPALLKRGTLEWESLSQ